MPIPRRRKGEPLEAFLERGHRELAGEFPDPKQRHAVLMRQVRKGFYEDLAEGARVEMEHTDDPAEAARIALDHLSEDRFYYVKLQAMEESIDKMASSVLKSKQEDDMDRDDREALEAFKAGLVRLGCTVAKAAAPEGTVSHRKDGDWKKTGGQWVKLPTSERQGQAGGAGKVDPAAVAAANSALRRMKARARDPENVASLRQGLNAWAEANLSSMPKAGRNQVVQAALKRAGLADPQAGADDKASRLGASDKKFTSADDEPKTSKYDIKVSQDSLDMYRKTRAGDWEGAIDVAERMGGRAPEFVRDLKAYRDASAAGKIGPGSSEMTRGRELAEEFATTRGRLS